MCFCANGKCLANSGFWVSYDKKLEDVLYHSQRHRLPTTSPCYVTLRDRSTPGAVTSQSQPLARVNTMSLEVALLTRQLLVQFAHTAKSL